MIRQHRLKIVGIVIMVAATGILMYLYGAVSYTHLTLPTN